MAAQRSWDSQLYAVCQRHRHTRVWQKLAHLRYWQQNDVDAFAYQAFDTQCAPTSAAGSISVIRLDLWLPNSHDLKLIYCKICNYQSGMHNFDKVKQHLLNVSRCMDREMSGSGTDSAIDERCGHLWAYVQANYGHLSSCCDIQP